MKKITVDSYSDTSNAAIIRLPERRFPGMVIQGDSLKIMSDLALDIKRLARHSSDDELRAAAAELCELLTGRVKHYEKVLAKERMELPYAVLKKAV